MNPRQDALGLLTADHADLMDLFESFGALCERGASTIEKAAVAEEICLSLTIHAQVEQEIFYPAVRAAIGDDALMDEAQVEHAEADDLNARISTMKPSDPLFDARVIVLGAAFDRHVKTAQRKMFPKVRRSGVDLMALGAQAPGPARRIAGAVQGNARPFRLGRRIGRPGGPPGAGAFAR